MSASAPNPSAILQTAFSFWSSKVLLTGVEFGVFTRLANRRLTGAELGAELKLHPRGIADFFDALVAMKFLDREGDGPQSEYFNTPEGALFLDEISPDSRRSATSAALPACFVLRWQKDIRSSNAPALICRRSNPSRRSTSPPPA